MYKSFTDAVSGQKKITDKILEQDHPLPLKDAARAHGGDRFEVVTDPKVERRRPRKKS